MKPEPLHSEQGPDAIETSSGAVHTIEDELDGLLESSSDEEASTTDGATSDQTAAVAKASGEEPTKAAELEPQVDDSHKTYDELELLLQGDTIPPQGGVAEQSSLTGDDELDALLADSSDAESQSGDADKSSAPPPSSDEDDQGQPFNDTPEARVFSVNYNRQSLQLRIDRDGLHLDQTPPVSYLYTALRSWAEVDGEIFSLALRDGRELSFATKEGVELCEVTAQWAAVVRCDPTMVAAVAAATASTTTTATATSSVVDKAKMSTVELAACTCSRPWQRAA